MAHAQRGDMVHHVRIDDLLGYRFLSRVRISPTGRLVAFVVTQATQEGNSYRSNIFLADIDADHGAALQLTTSGKVGPYAWHPDGTSLFFFSENDPHTEGGSLWQLPVTGSEETLVAGMPLKPRDIKVLPNHRILYTARCAVGEEPLDNDTSNCNVFDELPFWQNGEGITSKRRMRLFLLDLADGVSTALTDAVLEIKDFDVLAQRIVVLARRFDGKASGTDEVWLLDESHAGQCLTRDELAVDAIRFFDQDLIVALGTANRLYGRGENREVLMLDVSGGGPRSLTPGWDCSTGSSVLSDCRYGSGPSLCVDGDKVFVVVTERVCSHVIQLNLHGNTTPITPLRGSVDAFDVQDGRVVTAEMRTASLQELYAYSHEQAPKQLTDLNEEALRSIQISQPEPFPVSASDGTIIDAWLVRPTGVERDASCPTVLSIHGGPRAAFGDVFCHETQCLAAAGYAVLYANPRGSSGRGNVFGDLREKYGTVDYDDLMAVTDQALKRFPFLDADRLGVMGGSYGGFMTNWIIGHTSRFRAAVSQRCIANWISNFCTTDLGYLLGEDHFGTNPWALGGQEAFWDRSPLRYANKIKTPTLFIHAGADYRCYLAEGIQMFSALRYHGVESRLVLFSGENHELSRSGQPNARMRRLREIVAWFDRYLKAA